MVEEAKVVLCLQIKGLGSLESQPSISAWFPWFLLQTPYFWPTQQWPAEDTDYGKHSGPPMPLVVLNMLLIYLLNFGDICLLVFATFMPAHMCTGSVPFPGGRGPALLSVCSTTVTLCTERLQMGF